jgi:hypothetical protein
MMQQRRRTGHLAAVIAGGVLALIAGLPSGAEAVPLTEAACQRYAAERSILRRLDVEAHLARGPEWARENLTSPQLDLIQRYIKLDEALKFRCPERYATLVIEAPEEPRRLDVTPPPPVRKPVIEAARGGKQEQAPPLPAARAGREQG